MTGEIAFALGRTGLSASSTALTRNMAALAEQVIQSQARAMEHSAALLSAMLLPAGTGLGAAQSGLGLAVRDAVVDARRIGELWLAVAGAAWWPASQFLPDAVADELALPE